MRFALILALLPVTAAAEPNVTGDPAMFARIDAGIICADDTGTPEAAPGTVAGFITRVDGPVYVGLAARRVPALPGLAFGVAGEIRPGRGVQGVTITVTHPPMAPGGVTRQTWTTDLAPEGGAASFFRFDLPEERLPGVWTMQASVDDRVLYSARFEVVDPALMPDFADPCPGLAPIS